MRILDTTTEGKRQFIAIGDDLTDVQRWIRETPPTWSARSSVTTAATKDWDLGVGYEGAMKLAETGWSEGDILLNDQLMTHKPERDHADSWRYDVAGELPDIGRYLAGDPLHMRRHGHPKGHQPIVSLLIRNCCGGAVAADTFVKYGAALCTIVDQLENMGRRVEVNVADISVIDGIRCTLGWTVKQAEDSLDLAAMAFSLAHPAAPRRIGFAMCERTPREAWNYGQPASPKQSDWIDPVPNMYCLDGVGRLFGTQSLTTVIKHAVEQINKAAGEELVTVEG
jgi:hypothetical protein